MADLRAFLHSLAREPFRGGEMDCGRAVARWWVLNGGADPDADHRGVPAEEIAETRNLLRFVRDAAVRIGARKTTDPKPGDVAVVRWSGRHYCAIRTTSGRWAIKATNGLVVVSRCRPVMMWSV